MKTIPVYPNHTAFVDDADHERLSRYKWYLSKRDFCQYARRKEWVSGKRVDILMHRDIVDYRIVDHIDGNGLNNQRSNLRSCTQAQNCANSKLSKNNTSGFKGVSKHFLRWTACIRVNRIKKHLGCFDTPEQAAHAYDRKAIEVFGEFARLNFAENAGQNLKHPKGQ